MVALVFFVYKFLECSLHWIGLSSGRFELDEQYSFSFVFSFDFLHFLIYHHLIFHDLMKILKHSLNLLQFHLDYPFLSILFFIIILFNK